MRKALMTLAAIFMISAAFGQEAVTVPAKPQSPRAGRVLELREVFRISDAQGGFYFKGPSQIQAVPDGGLLVADEDELPGSMPRGSSSSTCTVPARGPASSVRSRTASSAAPRSWPFRNSR